MNIICQEAARKLSSFLHKLWVCLSLSQGILVLAPKFCPYVWSTSSDIWLVTIFSSDLVEQSLILVNKLRKQGKSVMLFPDEKAKLEKQLKYANKKGIETVYILGPEELEKKQAKVKNMKTGEQSSINL